MKYYFSQKLKRPKTFCTLQTLISLCSVHKEEGAIKKDLRVYKIDDDLIPLVFNINQIKSFRLERFQILMLKHTEKVVRIG